MGRMDKDIFRRHLLRAFRPWEDRMTAQALADYYWALGGVKDKWLQAALDWIGQNWLREKGMPTPGDVRAVADRIEGEHVVAKLPEAKPLTRHEVLDTVECTKRSLGGHIKPWAPSNPTERLGAYTFTELFHAEHSVRLAGPGRVNVWPAMDRVTTRAFTAFGGRDALRMVDAETVAMARKLFTELYVKYTGEEPPTDHRMRQAGDNDGP